MKHFMHLKPYPFEQIFKGEKTVELRLLDEKRKLIKVGDEIEFTSLSNSQRKITAKVIGLRFFKSFKALYEELPLIKCGYTFENVKNATYKDMEIYYSAEEQSRHGVVGIEFEVIFKG